MSSFAVFASGRGSNFEAILRAKNEGLLQADLTVLVCDRPEAPVIAKAKAAGVPVAVVPVHPGAKDRISQRALHEQEILKALQSYRPRFLVMAGYMRLLGPTLLESFREKGPRGEYFRIVNVHPSILPAFPGVDAYGQAFASGAQFAGVTVHLVDEKMDHGPICAQEVFSIRDCSTAAEVERLGLQIEHRLYPQTLKWILEENFTLEGNRNRVRPH